MATFHLTVLTIASKTPFFNNLHKSDQPIAALDLSPTYEVVDNPIR